MSEKLQEYYLVKRTEFDFSIHGRPELKYRFDDSLFESEESFILFLQNKLPWYRSCFYCGIKDEKIHLPAIKINSTKIPSVEINMNYLVVPKNSSEETILASSMLDGQIGYLVHPKHLVIMININNKRILLSLDKPAIYWYFENLDDTYRVLLLKPGEEVVIRGI